MPELPEVETITNALKAAVLGQKILGAQVFCRKFRVIIPDDFENKIKNARIVNIKRIAKYIWIELDNSQSILWHLGMSGKIKICESKDVLREKHDHAVIMTEGCTLVYNDARRFGMITTMKTSEVLKSAFFSKIGIDPFDKKFAGRYLKEKLAAKSIAIKVALLDQSIVNGIGNIYASEALFEARILPTRAANSLSLKEYDALRESIIRVLEKAIEAGGSTLRDYKKPDGSMGYFQNMHCVYNKTGQQCRDCRCDIKKTGGIKKIVQAGRSTFYCPVLQK